MSASDSNLEVAGKQARAGHAAEQGQKVRWALLVASLLLTVIAIESQVLLMERFTSVNAISLITIVTDMVSAAPLAICGLLVAWVRGPIMLRALSLLAGILTYGTMRTVLIYIDPLNLVDRVYTSDAPFWLIWAGTCSTGITVMTAMTMCLVVLGSILRVRIGPPDQGPVRFQILGLMLATALIALLVTGDSHIQHLYWTVEYGEGVGAAVGNLEQRRMNSLMIAGISGPVIALVVTVAAFAYRNYFAKVLFVLIPLAFAGFMGISSPNGNPAGEWGMGVAMIASGLWIAGNVWILARSGWPLQQRRPAS